jgi:hypothetical protein
MGFSVDISAALKQFQQLKEVPQRVADDAYKFFVAHTPIRKGNARRSTRLEQTTIVADYPYAERLDNGYSKQAPNGMSEPTQAEIERLLQKEITRLGQ